MPGIRQTTSTAMTDGLIRGEYNELKGGLWLLSITLSVPEAGEPIDLSKMVYYYSRNYDSGNPVPLNAVSPNSGMLTSGDSTKIRLNLETASLTGPMAGGRFSLEIKPPVGASTLIQRSLPDAFEGGYLP